MEKNRGTMSWTLMYRSCLRLSLGTLLCSTALASCTAQPTLPPEEVLARASRASQALQSASYTMNSSFVMSAVGSPQADVDLHATGVIDNAGKDLSMKTTLTIQQKNAQRASTIDFDLWVLGVNDVYFSVRNANIQAGVPIVRPDLVAQLVGHSWKLPSADAALQDDVTPHPRLLKAQAEIVDVTTDHGLVRENGRTVYKYDVVVSPEKLLAFLQLLSEDQDLEYDPTSAVLLSNDLDAAGTLSIDAQTFQLQSAKWTIGKLPVTDTITLSGTVAITLSDFDSAPSITPPTNAVPFTLDAMQAQPSEDVPETTTP